MTRTSLIKYSFLILCIIFLCNLNGIIFLLYRIQAPLSPLILFVCSIIIFISVFHLKVSLKSIGFQAMLLFYFSYLSIGLFSYLWDSTFIDPNTSLTLLFRSYISSILVIAAFYISAKVFIITGNVNFLLKSILVLSLLSVLVILLGPVLGIEEAVSQNQVINMDRNRRYGLFSNPNEAGSFSAYFIVISLTSYSYFKKGELFFLACFVLGAYAAVSSFSKAAMIITVVLIISFVLYNLKFAKMISGANIKKPLVMALFLTISTVIIIMQFFRYVDELTYDQRTRLFHTVQLFTGKFDENNTSERSELYSFAWNSIKHRPIAGYGIGVYHKMKDFPGGNTMGVHNTYLLILGESGFIPLLLFLFMFLMLIYGSLSHPSPSFGFFILGVCIVYFIAISNTGHNALDDRTSNAMIGISLALSQLRRNKECVV